MTPMTAPPGPTAPEIVYPDSDGKPMAENTKQLRWINLLYDNFRAMFHDRDDVFVAGDNFWYPVEGEPQTVFAPDVYVVFGRPKGDRGSYKQWLEGDIPLTVVFEILSPVNTVAEMDAKFLFYDEHGVEEYYVYDPDSNKLDIRIRGRQTLYRVDDIKNFTSPRLGIRFEMTRPEMTVHGPGGRRFIPFDELERKSDDNARRADENARRADENARIAAENGKRADDNGRIAVENARRADDIARIAAENARRADDNAQRADRLTELSRRVRRGQASPEEIAELDRLLDGSA